jgi:hypothetical protein
MPPIIAARLSSSPTSEHIPTEHRSPPVIPLHCAAVSPPPELRGAHKCAHCCLLHLPRPFLGNLEPRSGRRPSSGELPRSAMAPVHGAPKAPVVHGSPQPLPHKNNSEILENPNYLANSPLTFVPINPQSKCFLDFAIRPSVSDYNCRLAPSHLI